MGIVAVGGVTMGVVAVGGAQHVAGGTSVVS